MKKKVVVDPAQFVVRRDDYQQMAGFPEACAKVTEELIQSPPSSFSQAYEFVTERIKNDPILNRDWAATLRKGFGEPRKTKLPTDLCHKKYDDDNKEARLLYAGRQDITITHAAKPYTEFLGERGIALSRIYEDSTKNEMPPLYSIEHPPMGESADHMDEHRWSAISQNYAAAMDIKKTDGDRKKAVVEFYALLSHHCPYTRGSATLARILLEFLAHETNFTVPYAAPGIDINTKALLRTPQDFEQDWKQGVYFDSAATSQAIISWHRQRLIPNQNLSH